MGYHPDPLIQRLSAHLAEARRSAFVGCIGYVTADRAQGAWQHIPAYRTAFMAGVERARQLGYRLEEFWLGTPGMTGAKLSRIMEHRGIQGVILAPVPRDAAVPALDWKRFSAVAMGYSLARLKVHRAVNHQLNTGIEAIKQAVGLGYKRISLCVEHDQNKRVNCAWEQALLFHQSRIPASRRIKPHLPDALSEDNLLAWVKLEKPDCLLVHDHSICGLLRRAGYRVPEDIGVVLLDHCGDFHGDFAGMDQQHAQIGMACVELVVAQIFRNERGLPEHSRTVMTDSVWIPGKTVSER
jgi:DNA-binding LacI/PurR family transcriptional regulator